MSDNAKITTAVDNQGLSYWVNRLTKVDIPVLATVIREINQLTANNETSAQQLAQVILRDAALTAKVLKIANSVQFKGASHQPISTISQAVVQLGFEGIRAICLSVMIIDSLLKLQAKERMLEWLARAFHAAVQARNLVQHEEDHRREEVFIAALLLHIGEMAFWSSKNTSANALDQRLPQHSTGDRDIEKSVLGTTLRDITCALSQEWHMDQLLLDSLKPPRRPGKAVQAVWLGDRISLAAEHGWQSPELQKYQHKYAAYRGISADEAHEEILQSAEDAAAIVISYGANKVCRYIPSTNEEENAVAEKSNAIDPELQLNILREISNLANQDTDAHTLFQILVEGVHRGVGFERVGLCLLDSKKQLHARYALGESDADWREKLHMPATSENENLCAYALLNHHIVFNRRNDKRQLSHLIDARMKKIVDMDNCVIAGVYSGNRPLGVMVADRGIDGPAIEQAQYDSFIHFIQQANMVLAVIAHRR